MKYLFCLVFMLAQAPLFLHAQSNYKPGYVVNSKNDTLKGFVDYKEWWLTPKSIRFKSSAEKTPETFTTSSIQAFGVNNLEYYETHTVQVSKGETKFSNVSTHLDTIYAIETVPLKIIAVGKNVSFYSFTDNIKTRYYIKDNFSKQIDELKYFAYLDEESHNLVTKTIYQQQLSRLGSAYALDNNKINRQIENTTYSENGIFKIVKLINGGGDKQWTNPDISGSRFFAGAGFKYTTLTFNTDFPKGTKAKSTTPIINGGLDIFFNKSTKRLLFRTEISLSTDHYSIPPTAIDFSNTKASIDLKQYTGSIAPQILYNVYSTSAIKVFLDAGFALNFSTYNHYSYVVNYNNISTTTQDRYPDLATGWFSFPLKAGVGIGNHLQLYAAYTPNVLSGKFSSPSQAGFNYLFGK